MISFSPTTYRAITMISFFTFSAFSLTNYRAISVVASATVFLSAVASAAYRAVILISSTMVSLSIFFSTTNGAITMAIFPALTSTASSTVAMVAFTMTSPTAIAPTTCQWLMTVAFIAFEAKLFGTPNQRMTVLLVSGYTVGTQSRHNTVAKAKIDCDAAIFILSDEID
ncbi:hypothetical protein K493DRAFT_349243 [Basidiobolus meristosporus CBS 931.73]|uniref:Uncharacterized protein n=1 Tax=Basidiobolus meristosporus CBS 931.73 TaxID=1314790 RepID=A0A1Y1YL37_9FUNG|nr:hypothetical protein K493DRAFT_349243 [Basidiobolus meristosporus CBS 931.73]|eukprot:ORX98466.1 hypothetical protein K493DRAFT_349243 [Basidiobolus meristosporus CBS 931.73]